MPSFERESNRIVIAGASSLLGSELKSLREESRFASWDLRLVDEEVAAGTLTEAGGEPAVIQPVEEGSFDRARLIFFTGSPEFSKANLSAARHTDSHVVDLTGAALEGADDTRGGLVSQARFVTRRGFAAEWETLRRAFGGGHGYIGARAGPLEARAGPNERGSLPSGIGSRTRGY